MIVAMIGGGGGVGTSTLGLLLSVALREGEIADGKIADREVVLLEADRAGGTLGARFDLGVDGSLQAWVAGLATDPTISVEQFGKRVGDGLRVVPAPVGWTDTERILTPAVLDMLVTAITGDDGRSWIVDVGRGGGAASPLIAAADVAVVVTLGLPEQIVRLPSIVKAIDPVPCVVTVGGRTAWPTDEIQRHCGATAVIGEPGVSSANRPGGRPGRRPEAAPEPALAVGPAVPRRCGRGGHPFGTGAPRRESQECRMTAPTQGQRPSDSTLSTTGRQRRPGDSRGT